MNREINEFIRLVGSLSLDHSGKQRVLDFLNKDVNRREMPVKYVAVASAVAFLAVGTFILTRNAKQDISFM